MSWHEVLERRWPILAGDFQHVLHTDLTRVWAERTWRWFSDHVTYLLSTDTALAAVFAPDPEPTPAEAPLE